MQHTDQRLLKQRGTWPKVSPVKRWHGATAAVGSEYKRWVTPLVQTDSEEAEEKEDVPQRSSGAAFSIYFLFVSDNVQDFLFIYLF